ncbi:MAG: hypothetical protein KatS3mg029_0464 [Saprospiraceae bacterium]|nr:MAG: hypothetical protein KatS3mg029_0464 [Saprospiraceae bacterium]
MNLLPMKKTHFGCFNPIRLKSLWCALLTTLIALGSVPAFAQGWEIYFGGSGDDQGFSVIQTRDWGYVLTGTSESFGGDGDLDVYVVRTDVDGTLLWSNFFDEGFVEHGYHLIKNPDGTILVVGDILPTQTTPANVLLLKLNSQGQKLWSKQYGGSGTDVGQRIIRTTNTGGYLIVGTTTSMGAGEEDVLLVKIDNNGNQVWMKAHGTAGADFGRSVVELSDGYLITGTANPADNADVFLLKVDFNGDEVWRKYFDFSEDYGQDIVATSDGNYAIVGYTGLNSDVLLIKVTPDGDLLWSKTFGGPFGDEAYDMVTTTSGLLAIVGTTEVSASNVNTFIAEYDLDGNQVWYNNAIGQDTHLDYGSAIDLTHDGGFIVAGYNSVFGAFINDVTLVKTNGAGTSYNNHLRGKVFFDDNDCTYEAGELGLKNWVVKATHTATGIELYGTTNDEGDFDIFVDTGSYVVEVLPKKYWQPCVAAYNVSFSAQYDTLSRNFPITATVLCANMHVDVSAPLVDNCSNISYTINYCNYGTTASGGSTVRVIVDDDLTVTGSSIPWILNIDSLYFFDVGDIGLNECGSFTIQASSTCTGLPQQAYQVRAHILPDQLCEPVSPFWDKSSVTVEAKCDPDKDSVRFILRNDGVGAMQQPLNYIVIEDQIMMAQPAPFQLGPGQSMEFTRQANGSTYRIIAQQSANHPGESYPTAAVEGCTTNSTYSTGFVTMFHEDDNNPYVNIDVQEATSTTDYILLRGYPKGYQLSGDNLVPANTDVEYHIYFRNPTPETLQRLVVRDTLPASLAIESITPGASSHPYKFEIYSTGVVKFIFDDINLAPNGEEGDAGFVKFKVKQKPNNPDGTLIPNTAQLFLGYEEPQSTATYTHKVCAVFTGCLITDIEEPKLPNVEVRAYPNPFNSNVTLEVVGMQVKNLTIRLYDTQGRNVLTRSTQGPVLQLLRGELPAGVYTWQLEADDAYLSSGKLIAH